MRTALLLGAGLLALPLAASAQELEGAQYVFFESGKCSRLTVGGDDATPHCLGKMADVDYVDGRTTYMFFADKDLRIGFSGLRSQQSDVGDSVIQTIDKITMKMPGTDKFLTYPAKGSCRFSDPTKGPAPMICSATTAKGRFEADFLSGGEPMGVVD